MNSFLQNSLRWSVGNLYDPEIHSLMLELRTQWISISIYLHKENVIKLKYHALGQIYSLSELKQRNSSGFIRETEIRCWPLQLKGHRRFFSVSNLNSNVIPTIYVSGKVSKESSLFNKQQDVLRWKLSNSIKNNVLRYIEEKTLQNTCLSKCATKLLVELHVRSFQIFRTCFKKRQSVRWFSINALL